MSINVRYCYANTLEVLCGLKPAKQINKAIDYYKSPSCLIFQVLFPRFAERLKIFNQQYITDSHSFPKHLLVKNIFNNC